MTNLDSLRPNPRTADEAPVSYRAQHIRALFDERDRLAARVAELEAGLRPFARWCAVVDWTRGPHTEAPPHLREDVAVYLSGETATSLETLTVGDFRRARTLLNPEKSNDHQG